MNGVAYVILEKKKNRFISNYVILECECLLFQNNSPQNLEFKYVFGQHIIGLRGIH